MAPKNSAPSLQPFPTNESKGFIGYFHNTDPTTLPENALTYPSINGFIPNKDKFVPRPPTSILGQVYTANKNWPIIGHKKRFSNAAGMLLEVRVVQSDDTNLKDIIEVLAPIYTTAGVETGEYQWYRITLNINTFTKAVGRLGMQPRYYIDDWFDTNLDTSASLRVPRLVFVNSTTQVLNWTGGIAPITNIVASTSISTVAGTTWRSLGFVPASEGGSDVILINGVYKNITGGWNTNTLTLGDTSGISLGDVAFSPIFSDTLSFEVNSVRQNKNYLFYGSWKDRNYHMANNYNRPAKQEITKAQAVQNDLIVTGSYTGTVEKIVRYQITQATTPPQQYFLQVGTQPDNAVFSGTRPPNLVARDTYRVEITIGAPTPTAQLYLNNVATGAPFVITPDVPQTIGDGLSIEFINIPVASYVIGSAWTYVIGGQDKYTAYVDNVVSASDVDVDTPFVVDGVSMIPNIFTGHVLGDYWEVTLSPKVSKAWVNFYYTAPVRKPGEGYVYQLPSNFWTHNVQEEEMYVQGAYGEWGYITTQLSADLLSEDVRYTPLKQVSTGRVIYPYMIGEFENDIAFVTENKKFEMIGRRELVQLPQIGYLSQPVQLDFEACSFENGSMEYFDKRMYITSPKETLMMVFDNQFGNKYWQPPQVIQENGILSIWNNYLISHSNLRNQTLHLFDRFAKDGDFGGAYTVILRTAYNSFGDRWKQKASNATFLEGYIDGAPVIEFSLIQGVNGCGDILPHTVSPIMCIANTKAPLGEGNNASHPLGSDIFIPSNHFNEKYTKIGIINYTFIAFQLLCTTKNHTYQYLSVGVNAVINNIGTTEYETLDTISRD